MVQNKKAFTMIELVFVIVIIGILAAVAVPRLSATRDDAIITKARTTVASLRNAVSMERQKRILRGDFDLIYRLTDSNTLGDRIFNAFNADTTARVLENPPYSCANASDISCWRETQTGTADGATISQYTYNLPTSGSVTFILDNNRFECLNENSANCKLLTQ